MIKDEILSIRIQSKNRSHYESIVGHELEIGSDILINSNKIPKSSHFIITGICDFCFSERKIKMKEYNNQTNNGLNLFSCSKKCSILKTKSSNLKKYGCENVFQNIEIRQKSSLTKLNLYGNANFNNLEKILETNLKKYGFKTVLADPKVRNEIKKSYYENYGVYFPSQNQEVLEKMKSTSLKKYGIDNYSKTDMFKSKVRETWFKNMHLKLLKYGLLDEKNHGYTIQCNKCGKYFTILSSLMNKRISNKEDVCLHCNPINIGPSKMEIEILDFIKINYGGEIIANSRKIINGLELDIYLPNLGIGIEFNGLYWHSEVYKEKNYHLDKTNLAKSKNINLFHVWEDDWTYKQDIVKSMILNKLGKNPNKIFARKCEVKEVTDNNIIRKFLDKNHIQGFIGSKIKLGLYYNGELVSLMTFGNLRRSLGQKSEEGSYELLRFCNVLNSTVVGGASKLFKYFLDNFNPAEIISYSDLSRSTGDMYQKLGFKLSHNSDPNYYYVINGVRNHRFNFRKDKLVKEGFDPNKTEIQIMNERGFYRIFDCGMQKWILTK